MISTFQAKDFMFVTVRVSQSKLGHLKPRKLKAMKYITISITSFTDSLKLWLCRFVKINKDGNERRIWAVKMFKMRILITFKQA